MRLSPAGPGSKSRPGRLFNFFWDFKNLRRGIGPEEVAPRPGFGPGSGHELVRGVLRATAAYTTPSARKIQAETGLYYLGYLYDGLSAARILITLAN